MVIYIEHNRKEGEIKHRYEYYSSISGIFTKTVLSHESFLRPTFCERHSSKSGIQNQFDRKKSTSQEKRLLSAFCVKHFVKVCLFVQIKPFLYENNTNKNLKRTKGSENVFRKETGNVFWWKVIRQIWVFEF